MDLSGKYGLEYVPGYIRTVSEWEKKQRFEFITDQLVDDGSGLYPCLFRYVIYADSKEEAWIKAKKMGILEGRHLRRPDGYFCRIYGEFNNPECNGRCSFNHQWVPWKGEDLRLFAAAGENYIYQTPEGTYQLWHGNMPKKVGMNLCQAFDEAKHLHSGWYTTLYSMVSLDEEGREIGLLK